MRVHSGPRAGKDDFDFDYYSIVDGHKSTSRLFYSPADCWRLLEMGRFRGVALSQTFPAAMPVVART
jgi:hypothetical protein